MTDEHRSRFLHSARMWMMIAVGMVMSAVILQNTEEVDTQILFWTITMPRAALLGASLLAGFAAGVIWMGFRRRR